MRRLLISLAGLAVAVALVAAGCGDSNKQANEAYANSVCGAVATWEQEIKGLTSDLTAGDLSKASLTQKVTDAQTATKKLVTDVTAVPPPDTDAGRAAKQQLDQFTHDVSATIDAANAAVTSLPADASAGSIATAILTLGPQVRTLIDSGKAAFEALKQAGGDLSDAFKSADSCKNLG